MGFGILVLGYFLLLGFSYCDVIAAPIMFNGLRRLVTYCPDNREFKKAKSALLPFTVIAFVLLILRILAFNKVIAFSEGSALADAKSICDYVNTVLQMLQVFTGAVFNIFLFKGIYTLAMSLEVKKVSDGAVRCLTVNAVCYALSIIWKLLAIFQIPSKLGIDGVLTGYVGMFLILLDMVRIIFGIVVIYSAYMRICLEGDEDMPYRDTILDRLSERLDKIKNKK